MNFVKKNISSQNWENNKTPTFIRIIKLSIWLIIILLLSFYYSYSSFKTDLINAEEEIITIKSGERFLSLSERYKINNLYLKIYLKYNTPDFILEEAQYKIPENATISQIIEALKTPILPEEINITIFEGWNIFDIDLCLSEPRKTIIVKNGIEISWCLYKSEDGKRKYIKTGLIQKWEYIEYVENRDKITALTEFFPFIEWLSSLEWFLYPDTYTIDTTVFKINNFVILQLNTFESKVFNKIFKDTGIQITDMQDVINLASIVEKEERNPVEKSTVAGILKKRLNAGWMIGADITVCYPHRLTSQECRLVITKYIREKSEYNTRTKTGLPKTAIWNPNFQTIYATLNDKTTEFWYYLHNIKSGKIYYGRSNAEHEANKKYMY